MNIEKIKMTTKEMKDDGKTLSDREILLYIMNRIDSLESKFASKSTQCNNTYMTRDDFKTWLTVFFAMLGVTWSLLIAFFLWIKNVIGL